MTLLDFEKELREAKARMRIYKYLVIAVAVLCAVLVFCVWSARAEEIDVEKLATAIYHAENSTSHPYGILAHYKHTTLRQACINTINHALKDWDGKGDFISFLQKRYAPLNATNDPQGLNRNWTKNVHYFYGR